MVLCDWLLSLTFSSFIHDISSISFYCWVLFHCMVIPHCIYSFISWGTCIFTFWLLQYRFLCRYIFSSHCSIKWCLIVISICISLTVDDVELLCMCIGHFCVLWRTVYLGSVPILNWVVCLFNSLYILDTFF